MCDCPPLPPSAPPPPPPPTVSFQVTGCDCIIVDDMIDTGGTLYVAANALKSFGAARVFAFATHGLFNDPAADRIEECAVEEV